MGSRDDTHGGRVLLTGGSGFIASHILDCLLDHDFTVVVTVRTKEKGQGVLQSLDAARQKSVSFAIVGDISVEGAFDEAIKSDPPFDFVVHTASPCTFKIQDPYRDMINPAVNGTTGILKSIKKYGPSVIRVVITSSSAAIQNPPNHPKVYDETMWPVIDLKQENPPVDHFYKASKVFAERAAWDFMKTEQPDFDLVTINGTFTFGPIQRQLRSLSEVNASNSRVRDLVLGRMKDHLPPTVPVVTYVDVRDVALAHVRALTVPGAGNNRFYIVAGYFTNKRLADIVRDAHPELDDFLPPVDSVDDLPDDVYGFNNSKSRDVLGLTYRSLKESVGDTVASIFELQKKEDTLATQAS